MSHVALHLPFKKQSWGFKMVSSFKNKTKPNLLLVLHLQKNCKDRANSVVCCCLCSPLASLSLLWYIGQREALRWVRYYERNPVFYPDLIHFPTDVLFLLQDPQSHIACSCRVSFGL